MRMQALGQILGVAEQILRNVAISGVKFGASVGAKQLAESAGCGAKVYRKHRIGDSLPAHRFTSTFLAGACASAEG